MSKRPTCATCGKPIRATEAALYTNLADGTREHVHIACLREAAGRTQQDSSKAPTP